uniref:Uncharacterized protein n=1 Tax=Pongo abelii TaxID=9601 RepID=A0A8I5TRD3_PONAB
TCVCPLCGRGFAGASKCRRTCHLRLVWHSGPWLRFLLVCLPRSSFLYPCDQTVFVRTVADLGFLQFFLSKLHPASQERGENSPNVFGFLAAWNLLLPPAGHHCPQQVDSGSPVPHGSNYHSSVAILKLTFCWITAKYKRKFNMFSFL